MRDAATSLRNWIDGEIDKIAVDGGEFVSDMIRLETLRECRKQLEKLMAREQPTIAKEQQADG